MNKQKFLAMSLPYGLAVLSQCDFDNDDFDEICIYKTYHYREEFEQKTAVSDIQLPIIYPMSDITKEIEHNGEKFVPLVKLLENSCFDVERMSIEEIREYEVSFKMLDMITLNELHLYLKWHFDIAGLIEKGEAIDVNSLSENTYK